VLARLRSQKKFCEELGAEEVSEGRDVHAAAIRQGVR
jgi:hypothetical protein